MADAANRSRGSGRRVRGAFVPDVRCGYRNPTLSSILATQIPCRSCRSGAQAARRELCGVAITAGCKNGTPCRAASLRCCYSFYYIICFARVNGYFDDYYAVISSLLFTLFLCRFFSFHPSSLHPGIPAHLPSFSPIIPRAIPHNSKCRYGERGAAAVGAVLKPLGGNCAVLPKVYLKSKNAGYFHFSAAPQQKAAASNLPAAAYLIIIALPDVPLRFISITLRCHPGYLPQKHPSSFRCATYLFHLFPWRQPSAVVPGRSLWYRSGSARVLQ